MGRIMWLYQTQRLIFVFQSQIWPAMLPKKNNFQRVTKNTHVSDFLALIKIRFTNIIVNFNLIKVQKSLTI